MNKKQSLFHIAKRDTLPWYKSFAIRGCAILLALVVCAVVTMLLTGENPVNIFATIFKGAFGSARSAGHSRSEVQHREAQRPSGNRSLPL